MDVARMALPARCIASIFSNARSACGFLELEAQAAGYFLRLSGISALIVKSSESGGPMSQSLF